MISFLKIKYSQNIGGTMMKIDTTDAQKLFQAIEERRLSMIEAIELIMYGEVVKPVDESEISLTVDYSQSLEQMIIAGKYSQVDDRITEKNFPHPAEFAGKKIEITARLFETRRESSSKHVISVMDEPGYRIPYLQELLALGAKYLELQRQSPIINLRPINISGLELVSGLSVCGFDRKLYLRSYENDWNVTCRFLGILK